MSRILLKPTLLTQLRLKAGYSSVYPVAVIAKLPNNFIRQVEDGTQSIETAGGVVQAYSTLLNLKPSTITKMRKGNPFAYLVYLYASWRVKDVKDNG